MRIREFIDGLTVYQTDIPRASFSIVHQYRWLTGYVEDVLRLSVANPRCIDIDDIRQAVMSLVANFGLHVLPLGRPSLLYGFTERNLRAATHGNEHKRVVDEFDLTTRLTHAVIADIENCPNILSPFLYPIEQSQDPLYFCFGGSSDIVIDRLALFEGVAGMRPFTREFLLSGNAWSVVVMGD